MNAQIAEAPERTGFVATKEPATIRIVARETHPDEAPVADQGVTLELDHVSCFYGSFRAVREVSFKIPRRGVTALIGPSGCGKSTVLRTMNRMNDLIPSFRLEGSIRLDGQDLYDRSVDPVAVRQTCRNGLPEAEPVPQVDLRQRCVRREDQRLQGRHA